MPSQQYIAKTFFALEEILADELKELGAQNVQIQKRAVAFEADTKTFYKVHMGCRVALSIYKPLISFKANTYDQLYDEASKFDWSTILDLRKTFSIGNTVYSQELSHSKFATLRLKDAIVDHFYKKHNRRPDVELQNPDVIFHLHVSFNDVTISMDSSGPGLYKRGYRVETTEAPMNEVLAAGIIKLSGWDGKKPFLDPMCGSGTFPIEAAMIAQNNAPNFYRNDFAFQKWDDFDEDAYEQARMELLNSGHKAKVDIQGSDNNQGVLGIAKGNVRKAFLDDFIEIEKANFHDLDRNGESGFMIINPPYDERMYLDDAIQYYKDIGDTLKQRFNGWECWIVSSHKQALKQMGLKADAKIDLYNGPLEIRLNQYRIF